MRRPSVVSAAVAVLGLAAAALLLTAPAAAADGLPVPTLSKTSVAPGETFTVSGAGCFGHDVGVLPEVLVIGPGSATAHAAPDGTWSVTVSFGPTAYSGRTTIAALCEHAPLPAESYPPASITLVGPPQWWQTCGPLPGSPGVTGCPGPPDLSPPPPAQRTRTTAPRRTPARTPAAGTTPPVRPPSVTSSAPTSTTAEALAPTPAAGCRDCARLTGGGPVAAGDRLELRYGGFGPGERVAVALHSTPVDLGTFTADASGVVTTAFAVPTTLEAGNHRLTLTGERTGDRVVGFRLTAAPGSTAAPPRAVADGAGSPVAPFAVGGATALLLAAGGSVLVLRRRAAGSAATADPEHRLVS